MDFHKLVRYEHDGHVHYGDLLEHFDEGFKVVELQGDLTNGFKRAATEPITVQNVTITPKAIAFSAHFALASLSTRTDTPCSVHWGELSPARH